MNPKIVLVPFPLTPLSAFAYFLFGHCKLIGDDVVVRFNPLATDKNSKGAQNFRFGIETPLEGAILNLGFFGLENELKALLAKHDSKAELGVLKRWLNYCQAGDNQKGKVLQKWLTELTIVSLNDPKAILNTAARSFVGWLKGGIDPNSTTLAFPHIPAAPVSTLSLPPDTKVVTIPIFKENEESEEKGDHKPQTVIATTREVELHEGKAWHLCNMNIGIVVGGPPNSGKSTLTMSLTAEVQNIIKSLKTRGGWEGFNLSADSKDLDLATQTVAAIKSGEGKDSEAHKARKQPWTSKLALEAFDYFRVEKGICNIIFADLPGKYTDITELLSAQADAAIFVTSNWAEKVTWSGGFGSLGIPIVCEARSHLAEAGLYSVITTYNPKDTIIAGRVVGLERVTHSWDRFVSWLAEFLLFELLPKLVLDRREKLKKLIHQLEQVKQTTKANIMSKHIAYSGVFLTPESKAALLESFPAKHPKVLAEHMTIQRKPSDKELADLPMGKEVKMRVIGYADDSSGQAVVVEPEIRSEKPIPHITISVAEGIHPEYSNDLLAKGFQAVDGPVLTGIVDLFPREN